MKTKKKVNPYEKKVTKRRRITKSQRTAIISLVCAAVILVGIAVMVKLSNADVADEHAGHNHAAGDSYTDGEHYEGDGHDHGTTDSSSDALSNRVYTNADGTYRLQVIDKDNKVVFERNKLYNAPVKEKVSEHVTTLGWATGTGANDFEHIYYNTDTGEISTLFYAPRGCDGVRVAYSSADQTKIIVQDIFNKNTYYKEYPLEGAYTGGDYVIQSGKLTDSTVTIFYVVGENNKTTSVRIPLYG